MPERGPRTEKALEFLIGTGLIALIFFLRLPGLSESFCDPDQGTPAYASRLLLEGHCPYDEAVITKPPGTVLLYTLLFRLFGLRMFCVHFFASLWACTTALLLYTMVKRRVGMFGGATAAGLYGLYQAEIVSSGICANFEFWTTLPALGSLFLATEAQIRRSVRMAGLGACIAIGLMMKQTMTVFGIAAILVLLLGTVHHKEQSASKTLTSLAWMTVGFSATLLPFFLAMKSVSCTWQMFRVLNPLVLNRYLGTVSTAQRWDFFSNTALRFACSNGGLLLMILTSLVAIVFHRGVRGQSRLLSAQIIFLGAAIMSVFSGGRFFGHYFVVLLPFIILIIGTTSGIAAAPLGRPSRAVFALAITALALFDSWAEWKIARMSAGSFMRTDEVMSKEIFDRNHHGEFGQGFPVETINQYEWDASYRQLAGILVPHLRPSETIWCFDYMPEMYYYTRTFAPTRNQENFEIIIHSSDPWYGLWHNSIDEIVKTERIRLMRDLSARPPVFVVRNKYDCTIRSQSADSQSVTGWPKNIYGEPMSFCPPKMELFPELAEFLSGRYQEAKTTTSDALQVYELINSGSD
jgi:hypothetical protein